MKVFEIAVGAGNILGKFESKDGSLQFNYSEKVRGNYITNMVANDEYIYVSLDKLPEEISVDNEGAIWIGKCKVKSFECKPLWLNPEDKVAKLATEIAKVYDELDEIQFKDFVRAM